MAEYFSNGMGNERQGALLNRAAVLFVVSIIESKPLWCSHDALFHIFTIHLQGENNYMVRKLIGKTFHDTVFFSDLEVAKEIIRQRVLVGLVDQMEESVRRFNLLMGVDETDEQNQQCINGYIGVSKEKGNDKSLSGQGGVDEQKTADKKKRRRASNAKNVNKYLKVCSHNFLIACVLGVTALTTIFLLCCQKIQTQIMPYSREWQALANKNNLDMLLYDFILEVFRHQTELVKTYKKRAEWRAR